MDEINSNYHCAKRQESTARFRRSIKPNLKLEHKKIGGGFGCHPAYWLFCLRASGGLMWGPMPSFSRGGHGVPWAPHGAPWAAYAAPLRPWRGKKLVNR